MITDIATINDCQELETELKKRNLDWKDCWDNYVWLDKKNYYRLVLFSNGEYGLFTQSQLPIVKAHGYFNSPYWKDYKPYADAGYKEMRPCTAVTDNSEIERCKSIWTPIRKQEFRNGSEWKKFKTDFKYWNTNCNGKIKCEDCGAEIEPCSIEIHHLFPDDYGNLDRRKFKILCHVCHTIYTERGE